MTALESALLLAAGGLIALAVDRFLRALRAAGDVIDAAVFDLHVDQALDLANDDTPIFDALVSERAEFVASVLADIDALGGDQ